MWAGSVLGCLRSTRPHKPSQRLADLELGSQEIGRPFLLAIVAHYSVERKPYFGQREIPAFAQVV